MNILFLTDRFLAGGAETHMTALAATLIKKGHCITVVSAGGVGVRMLEERGIPHRRLSLASKAPSALFSARRGLSRLLKEGAFDVVHAHARLPAACVAPFCRKRGIPLVVTAHWVFRSDGWRGRFSAWGDHTLAVSEDICRYLEKDYRIPRASITKTQNGIDTDRFSPSAVDDGGKGVIAGVRLLHTSRLDAGRARCAELLIELAPRLAEGGASSLLLVGGGDREKALRAAADAANRRIGRDFIIMTGAVTDVLPYFRGAGIFIGVSRAALEGMACGLPVILAGDEGFLPLVTEESASAAEESNFCGRGLCELSADGLFSALTALLADPEKRRTVGSWGRAYMLSQHTADAMARDALLAYRAATEKKKAPKPRIFLCGYYGYGNLGDEAVLSRLVGMLDADFSLTVLSGDAAGTQSLHGVKAVSRRSPLAVMREIRRAELFLLGGGNLIQNETSNRSLSYYTQLLSFARRAGCRTVLLGGVGRLDARGERRVREILPFFHAAFLRTPRDLRRFCALGGRKERVHLFPDGGLFVYGNRPPVRERSGRAKTVLISLRRGDDAAAHLFLKACRALVAAGENCRFVGLSMQGVRDHIAFRDFADLPHFSLLSPSDFDGGAEAVARADLVFSTRLHALIFATAAGVPSATVACGGKLSDFAALSACAERVARGKVSFPPYPMLTLLREETPLPVATFSAMLHTPPNEGARAVFLRELQKGGAGEGLVSALKKL